MAWLPTMQPPVNGTRRTYWASIAQIVSSSNLSSGGIRTRRSLPADARIPADYQPPVTHSASDSALKGLV
jgi:hypothetical protein